LKLLWASVLLYLWLTFNVFHIWENLSMTDDVLQEDIFTWDQELQDDLKDLIWKHNISESVASKTENKQTAGLVWESNEYKMKFQKICISNMSVCSKIKFEWEYTYKDKYMYLATAIYVINKISANIQLWRDIVKQLDELTINNEIWKRRWFATWDKVVINLWTVSSYSEYFELLWHELWHIVDLWVVRWFSHTKSSVYTEFGRKVFEKDDPSLWFYALSWQSEKVRKSDAVKDDFCSGYGMTDPFEDFAECHNLYLNHNAIFKKMATKNNNMRKKYNFMANLYGWKYLFNASEDLKKIKYNESWRPWDTTRM